MALLSVNPEVGRRSGDVWSVFASSSLAVQKGDMICLSSGAAVIAASGVSTDSFLGIADESKSADEARDIIVITKGVFPFNKASDESFLQGDELEFSDNNTVTAASGVTAVAACYKAASSSAAYVYAKIHSQI